MRDAIKERFAGGDNEDSASGMQIPRFEDGLESGGYCAPRKRRSIAEEVVLEEDEEEEVDSSDADGGDGECQKDISNENRI